MRFLHTSDWHVGKPLRNHKRDEEYTAALVEVLTIARDQAVDAVLIAGDVFDSAVPPPEAERIIFGFFGELYGAGIPAVVVAGNHDHPRRWNAYSPVLRHLGIRVLGDPVPAAEGGVIELPSRDGKETATIAMLPWVSERKVRDFGSLMAEGQHFTDYAQGIADMLQHLCGSFRPDTVNILLAHVFLRGAAVAQDSGERPMSITDVYAVAPQIIPGAVQYAALGHVHNPEQPKSFELANAHYCGSLLQCDFGEAGQEKRVNIVDVSPGRKAKVTGIPLTSIRQLRNLGSHKEGLTLDELKPLAEEVGDAYLKVFLKADRPVPGLAEQVREILPNAVDIVVQRPEAEGAAEDRVLDRMTPLEMFTAYYRDTHGSEPGEALIALFNRLYEEATVASDQA